MKRIKMLASAAVALWGILAMPVCAADTPDLQMIINDTLYVPSEEQVGPQLLGDRVYVPLRLVGESLEHQVQWLEQSRSVCIFTDDNAALLPENAYPAVAEDAPITIYIDGEELKTDSFIGEPYVHESGRAMVPVRVVMEQLSCDVQWQDYVVLITESPQEAADTPAEDETVKDSTAEEDADSRENDIADVTTRNQGTEDRDANTSNDTSSESNASADSSEDEQESPWYYDLSIQGQSIATADELQAFLDENEDAIRNMMEQRYPELGFTPYPDDIAELYIEIGERYNIRGDLAFAQAVKETGYFQFYGKVQAFQNNFCGLGASGIENTGEEKLNGVDAERAAYIPGLHGLSFTTVEDGVEAHIQHLYAYATTDDLPEGCELIDPRFKYVNRGVAPLWTDLNGRWAIPGNGYGESIIEDYWMKAAELE